MQSKQGGLRVPAAERLAGTLRGRIERGDYRPGEWLPTERELAAEFRADRSTIRSAISSLAERQLIVREPGRRPRVRSGSSPATVAPDRPSPQVVLQALAMLSPQTPHYPAFPAIQSGALQALTQHEAPYHLIVFDNNAETRRETIRRERLELQNIERQGIQGVLIWPQGNEGTLPDLRRLQKTSLPVVLMDRRDPTFVCDFVGIDNTEAAREAVTYLLDLGHRRIGHLTMDDSTITVRGREQGYREALLSHGICPRPEWVVRMSNRTHLQPPVTEAVDHFLSLPEPPTAIFAMNDLLAHALIRDLQGRGWGVPERLSVMGFDDMDRYALSPSPLTTVHQPFEEMGRQGMELLLGRLAVPPSLPTAFQHVVLPTHLVIRSSCRPTPS